MLFKGPHFQHGLPDEDARSPTAYDIDWVIAQLLVRTLKESEGGWKLSMETIVILGVCFEDEILGTTPKSARGNPAMLHQLLENSNLRRKKQ